ncbi:MAG: hypothetical protein K1W28_01105 [Lachnospiraceae bacterium]
MIKKLTALTIAVFLIVTGTAACGGGGGTSQGNRPAGQEEIDPEQMEKEIQKMKDEGVLDENGQPMPGVDLNDYPGLG